MQTFGTVSDDPIHLGRVPLDECMGVQLMCAQCEPFPSSQFVALEDTTFVAVIGPAANPRGYTAITGTVNVINLFFNNLLFRPERSKF